MNRLSLSALAALISIATTSAASLYVGDVAADGAAVPGGTVGPDTANAGAITYAFFSAADTYTNSSGGAQLLQITEANFSANAAGTVTPFVAVLLGGGAAGADYNVLAKGDGITAALGLNNAAFTVGGSNPTVTLNNGETLVAGFHQSTGMIPWESPGGSDGDYLSDFGGVNGGDNIPAGGGPLGDDANWSTLGREYRFNVGFDVVPEPSVPFLLLVPGALFAMLIRRRRTN